MREECKLMNQSADSQFHLFHGESRSHALAGTSSERKVCIGIDITLILRAPSVFKNINSLIYTDKTLLGRPVWIEGFGIGKILF